MGRPNPWDGYYTRITGRKYLPVAAMVSDMRFTALHLFLAGVALLVVLGASTPTVLADEAGNVTLYQSSDAGFDDVADVEGAIDGGSAEPADELVTGETLVVVIDSEELATDLDSRRGSATDRFFEATDDDATFEIVQSNPSPERAPKELRLDPEGSTVYRSGRTTFVLVDTATVTFWRPDAHGGREAELRDEDRFGVLFGYDSPSRIDVPEFELSTTAAEFLTLRGYSYEPLPPERFDRPLNVYVAPDDRLVGRLSLVEGPTVVDEAGHDEELSFDLRDIDPGTRYRLELVHDGTVLERRNGTVVEPRATLTDLSVARNATRNRAGRVTVLNATVNLSHGGHVEVLTDDGERLGRASTDVDGDSIEPGHTTRVSITFLENRSAEYIEDPTDVLRVRAAREHGATREYYDDPNASVLLDYESGDVLDDRTRRDGEDSRGTGDAGDPEDQSGYPSPPVLALFSIVVLFVRLHRRL